MQAEEAILKGLTARTRNLLRALDRQDRLETATVFADWLSRQGSPELAAAAQEVFLRALGALSDPINFRLLKGLDPLLAASLPDLMEATGLERVAVSERLNDMVQVGLVSRELIDDQIRCTDLATGLVTWVEGMAQGSGEQLGEDM